MTSNEFKPIVDLDASNRQPIYVGAKIESSGKCKAIPEEVTRYLDERLPNYILVAGDEKHCGSQMKYDVGRYGHHVFRSMIMSANTAFIKISNEIGITHIKDFDKSARWRRIIKDIIRWGK